jgi:hypothetical protein
LFRGKILPDFWKGEKGHSGKVNSTAEWSVEVIVISKLDVILFSSPGSVGDPSFIEAYRQKTLLKLLYKLYFKKFTQIMKWKDAQFFKKGFSMGIKFRI